MPIIPASLAAVNGVTVENQQFAVAASVIPQKNVIIGTYDETTFTDITPNVPIRVFSAEDVGAKTGFGFMLHRLAQAAFRAGVVETWIIPQAEAAGVVNAAGELTLGAGPATAAGNLVCYIAGKRYSVPVAVGDTVTNVGDALEALVNADENSPVELTNAAGVITVDAKMGGTYGNDITLAFNLQSGESVPAGITAAVTGAMATGAGIPDIQDALDALGTGDGQNDGFFTNLIHGYGFDTTTLDAISTYNGLGNLDAGNYSKTVARPFRSLVGDTTAGSAGLAAVLVLTEARRELDRTNGVLCAPGEYYHPQELAAQAIGIMAVTNSIRAEETYIDKPILTSYAAISDRWTNDFDSRDQAVRGGAGTTMVKNGILTLQNVITFYRPAAVAQESNGYRAMRNISIIQNLLYNYRQNFERSKWKGITIVEDVAEVSNITSRQKARDVDAVLDDLVALADAFAANAWLYTAAYTKSKLQSGGYVALRAGLTGFDIIFPVILSGEGGIYNSLITFDTSIAVLLGGE